MSPREGVVIYATPDDNNDDSSSEVTMDDFDGWQPTNMEIVRKKNHTTAINDNISYEESRVDPLDVRPATLEDVHEALKKVVDRTNAHHFCFYILNTKIYVCYISNT